ncbi:transposase [Actinomadura miaoliensis]|uniref:Transposase IS116/IS110/IS902 C-terminal domain-containing protein n=1 Tax=Actinomadura miaoliensis TaxID=430685 RepID=A0ABP7X2F5_9ACTN
MSDYDTRARALRGSGPHLHTQTINRLHALLTKLVPAGLPRKLTADTAAAVRWVRPEAVLACTLRALAVDLVFETRRRDLRITAVAEQISAAVAESGSTLTELHGIGDLLAAKILARTAGVDRFRSAAAFASYCGVAPLDASSGDVKRHRLSRAGDRQLNSALHIMAITQIRRQTAGRDFYQRKRAEGKSHREALRSLKRRLCDVVYRTMIRDTDTSLLTAAHREVPLIGQTHAPPVARPRATVTRIATAARRPPA